jgi:hypothetical protein
MKQMKRRLAKSFHHGGSSIGGAAIPKVLATFATTKSDGYFSNDAYVRLSHTGGAVQFDKVR